VRAAAGLVAVHLAIVLWMVSPVAPDRRLLAWGGLERTVAPSEPWRLLTSLFLHVDPAHVLWNGLSMLVFAVALIGEIGYGGTALIYLAAGVGGGVAALAFAEPGTIVVGSSGAVAGLFGAWVAWTFGAARRATLTRRARFRTIGIALLVLPALLNPTTASGQSVSVSSHLGGMATGVVIGVLLGAVLRRGEEPDEEEPEARTEGEEF